MMQNNKIEDKFLDGEMFAEMLRGGAAQLRYNADEVNNLNVFPVPDGDTGDNMRMTIEGGVRALDTFHSANLAEVTRKLSQGMLLGARGNSGVILSQFFAGMSKGFMGLDRANPYLVGAALEEGVRQAYASVITPTEGTILTVAREAVEYTVARISDKSTITGIFADLIGEMYASLQRTPDILPVLKEANVIDSGGAGLFYIIQGFHKVLIGEEIEQSDEIVPLAQSSAPDLSAFGPDSEMTYGYCTELLLQLQHKKVDIESFDEKVIIEFLKTIGDSIVCFKQDSIVKLHVHTLTPDAVLGFCRKFGEFLTVKIENMSVQHSETEAPKPAEKPEKKLKEFGTVAVAQGKGIKDLFLELGVDYVVEGGQTQNPSAQDFVAAFEEVGAKNIYVFPNNGNIIMAAKQAAQLWESGSVYVIESKDLGMGYAAISSLNFQSKDPEKIAETLTESMQLVRTGAISTSIRNADLNGVHIECGDYIGFCGKEMLTSEKTLLTASAKLLAHMAEQDEMYLVTAFVGSGVDEETVETLRDALATDYPDVEFYAVDGKQDIYPFIFVVE